jgi:hypothetical protein
MYRNYLGKNKGAEQNKYKIAVLYTLIGSSE